MEELQIRAVIKYFCRKGMSPKEIHEDFMGTLGKESPSYCTVKTWAAKLRGGERVLRIMDGVAAPKMSPLMKATRTCTPWLCVIVGETCEVGKCREGSTINPNLHLIGMLKVSSRWVPRMLTDDQKRTWLDISRFSYLTFLFDLILYVPSTIFQLNRDGSSWVEPVLS